MLRNANSYKLLYNSHLILEPESVLFGTSKCSVQFFGFSRAIPFYSCTNRTPNLPSKSFTHTPSSRQRVSRYLDRISRRNKLTNKIKRIFKCKISLYKQINQIRKSFRVCIMYFFIRFGKFVFSFLFRFSYSVRV